MQENRTRNTVLGRETKGKRPLEILRGKQNDIKIKTIRMLCCGEE